MAFGEQFKQLFIWGSTYTFLCIDNDKLLSPTSCVGKYFILIRRFRSFPTFDVMQPTNQPWSISVAIYSPTNTKTAVESRTDDIILPLRIFAHDYYKLRTTLGSYFRYESSMVSVLGWYPNGDSHNW